jgi:ribosomal protein L11 methylase PrmA
VLANLTAAVLHRYASALQRLVADGGLLVVSGFSGEEVEEIASALRAEPQEVLSEGEWAAAALPAAPPKKRRY